MREAVRKRDKIDYNEKLEVVFELVKNGELDFPKFTEKMKELFRF